VRNLTAGGLDLEAAVERVTREWGFPVGAGALRCWLRGRLHPDRRRR
jgi:hypothetical protein